ncbi:MAG: VOC family protein [Hyalangium sp.]|uniref:VOC family protein n=1 Tax=Hyalangium sp. TaxID=2028555 RepID=UPI00389A06B0
MAKPIPEGYHTVTPYLIVKGAARALDFYKKAFNATELYRMEGPGGTVGHAEFKIGNSIIMISDESPQMGAKSPETLGGSPAGFCIYVENVDALFKQAISAGAKEERPLKDQFYGDRSGMVRDPFGHQWTLATHVEDVAPEEMKRRMDAAMKQGQM